MKKIMLFMAVALSAAVFAMPEGFTDDWDAAFKKAAKEKKVVLALFTGSDWCIWCKRLEGEILSKKAFSDEVGKYFVPVYIDFPNDSSNMKDSVKKRNRELATKYSIRGFPTVLLINYNGTVKTQTGYQRGGPEKYMEHLKGLIAPKTPSAAK